VDAGATGNAHVSCYRSGETEALGPSALCRGGDDMTDMVRLQISGTVAVITNDHPEKRHAFDDEMDQRLFEILNELPQRHELRSVVWQAEGNSFSSGPRHFRRWHGDHLGYRTTASPSKPVQLPAVDRLRGHRHHRRSDDGGRTNPSRHWIRRAPPAPQSHAGEVPRAELRTLLPCCADLHGSSRGDRRVPEAPADAAGAALLFSAFREDP
jgi:hypothetical protein